MLASNRFKIAIIVAALVAGSPAFAKSLGQRDGAATDRQIGQQIEGPTIPRAQTRFQSRDSRHYFPRGEGSNDSYYNICTNYDYTYGLSCYPPY
jgi:hypothetical protein